MDKTTEPVASSQISETTDEQARIQKTIQRLRTLLDTDAQEQRETFEYLKQALGKDHYI